MKDIKIMMNNTKNKLNGKNILFLTWPFYQYPDEIKKTMEKMGANVDMYYSAPTTNFLKIRFLEKFEKLKKKYFGQIIESIKEIKYDYIFVINAAVFPEYFFKEMSLVSRNSIKILYSWDSIKVYPKALSFHKYFDRIYSFDSEDTKKYTQMIFLPLFFCEDINKPNNEETLEYDFSFIGFGHTERYKFINKIKKFAIQNNYTYFFKLYLPSKLHFLQGKYIKKLFPDAIVSDFVYKPVSYEMINGITQKTRVIIDMELRTQTGLTMRTIETHGMHKKLITTNEYIKQYDFYNPDNILVVDRDNPEIPNSFMQKEYVELPSSIYTKYSLTSWVKTIFRLEDDDEN